MFFAELPITLAFPSTPFPCPPTVQAFLSFCAEFDLGGLPLHVGDHEIGVTKSATDEILLARLGITDKSSAVQRRYWHTTVRIIGRRQRRVVAQTGMGTHGFDAFIDHRRDRGLREINQVGTRMPPSLTH